MVGPATRVALTALAARVGVLALGVAFSAIATAYDTCAEIDSTRASSTPSSAADEGVRRWLGPFANWDAVFFLRIASSGYEFEQFHAFFPLLPLLVRIVSKTVLAGVSSYWGLSEYASLLVAGVLLTNLAYVGAAVVFFHLTRLVFGSERFAFRAALLLTVAPIGIFASAIYTESPFLLFTLLGLWAVESVRSDLRASASTTSSPSFASVALRLLLAGLCFGGATGVRSNGLLLVGFLAFATAEWVAATAGRTPTTTRSVARIVVTHGASLGVFVLASLLTITPFLLFQWYGYWLYCAHPPSWLSSAVDQSAVLRFIGTHVLQIPSLSPQGGDHSGDSNAAPSLFTLLFPAGTATTPDRPWCPVATASLPSLPVPPPSLYGYVQEAYWDVGPFRYYTAKQIPNFVFASPVLAVSFWAALQFFRHGRVPGLRGDREEASPEIADRPSATAAPKPAVGRAPAAAAVVASTGRALWTLLRATVWPCAPPRRGSGIRSGSPLDVAVLAGEGQEEADGAGERSGAGALAANVHLRLLPYALHWFLLAGTALVVMHVQVATRFLFAACPPLLWWVADLWLRGGGARTFVVVWSLAFTVVGAMLFPNFYPWT